MVIDGDGVGCESISVAAYGKFQPGLLDDAGRQLGGLVFGAVLRVWVEPG